MKLFVCRDGEELPALSLSTARAMIGRGSDMDLVVTDPTTSGKHAQFWLEGGRAWVRDMGSRNGTWVNEERVRTATPIEHGDQIRLGADTRLIARGVVPDRPEVPSVWWIEHVEAALFYPMAHGSMIIGPGAESGVPLDVPPEAETVVAVHPGGEIWRSTVDEEAPLAPNEVFAVGSSTFRVVEQLTGPSVTHELVPPPTFKYHLMVTLDGVTGAEAVLEDRALGTRHAIEAENRAVLLYVLGKRAVEAQQAQHAEESSWCADDEVSTAVWGKRGTSDGNSLHVLVHRLRKELKGAGFDPWFIEKRRKAIRLALKDVDVR